MDYAERGAIEKTFDQLLNEDSDGLSWVRETHKDELLETEDELTPAGQLYAEGVLTGMLATLRTFLDETPDFVDEDAEEINQIIERRQVEMANRLMDEKLLEDSS